MAEINNSRENIKNSMKKPEVGRGPGARYARMKEKPKNTKATIKRLVKYLMDSKALVILLLIVVIGYTALNLYSSILIKDVANSLGEYNSETGLWNIEPNMDSFYLSITLLLITYVVYCVL